MDYYKVNFQKKRKKDCKEHHENYDFDIVFDCKNHNKYGGNNMTDEEKACKTICDSIPCKTMCTKCKCYLAGLKAGRPQWHKVADGDLPKENKLYLVQIKDNGLAIAYFNGRHWETRYNLGESGHCVETVIAWREIPTFEE